MTQTRRPDGKPETPADTKFFDQRAAGYRGPIDQHGNATTEQTFLRSTARNWKPKRK